MKNRDVKISENDGKLRALLRKPKAILHIYGFHTLQSNLSI